jgi:hypothetical protein
MTTYQTAADWLRPGDITPTWCGLHMDRTDHLYRPGTKTPLTCLDCFPNLDPRRLIPEGNDLDEQK